MASLLTRLRGAAALVLGRKPDERLIAELFPSERSAPVPRGTAEYLEAYKTMPWLRATVHRISTGVAAVEWHAYAVRRRGRAVRNVRVQRAGYVERKAMLAALAKAGELDELDNHQLLDMLHRPNPFVKGVAFRRLTAAHLDLAGEAAWMIERDGLRVPTALWPLPPHWITDVPSPRRPVFTLSLPYGGWQGDVPMSEIVWFVDPDPHQPYGRGAGTARALGDELETDEFAAKHTRAFFYNSARPDLVITVKGARDSELRAAEQRWLSRLQGFWRAFKPHFVSREVDVKEIGTTLRDMQFTQLRQHERDTIIQVFGVPPEILGVLENSNRATIEAADYLFARHVLVPRLELIRETVQEHLAPLYDERLVIDYTSPVSEDKAHQLEAAKAMPAVLTVNEWRAHIGAEELPGPDGRVHLMPPTLVAVEHLASGPPVLPPEEPEDEPLPPGDEPPEEPEEPEDGEGEGEPVEQALRVGAGNGNGHRAVRRRPPGAGMLPAGNAGHLGGMLGPVVVQRAAEDFLSVVERVAQALEPRWRRRFIELVESARPFVDLETLEAALRTGRVQTVLDALAPARDALARRLGGDRGVRALVRATVAAAVQAGIQETLRQLGIAISWTEPNRHALAYIARHTGELITHVSDSTVQAVREIIERSFREAIAPRDAARLIRQVVGLRPDQATAVANFRGRLAAQGVTGDVLESRVARYAEAQLRRRALVIARTETIKAANAGQQLLWNEGVAQGTLRRDRVRKVWLVTPDDRLDAKVCEPMPFLEENRNVPIDGVFTTGTGDLVAHPPAHPNCRCAMGLKLVRP